MMEKLSRRAEMLAAAAQRRQVQRVAARMKELLGSSAVDITDAQVAATGRDLLKRWLIDPSIRFLSSGFK